MSEKIIKFNLPIPKDILTIKDIFLSYGFKLYIVGGAVRDSLLEKPIKDWDLATDATPDKVEEMMEVSGIRTLPTGKSFGVINVFTDSNEFEIATFRSDLSSGRRPDSVEFTTIDKDVLRRDLTINALFFDIDTNEIVDLVGGVEDIKNGVVRTVGKAEERFNEDRLRILRAIRFAGRFGSNLHTDTEQALMKDSSLEGVSGERIRDEFLKGVKTSKSVNHFLTLTNKFGLFKDIFKGLIVNNFLLEERDPILLLTVLLRDNNLLNIVKTLNKLKYSSEEIRGIKFLILFTKFVNDKSIFEVSSMKKEQKRSGLTPKQIVNFSKLINLDEKFVNTFIDFELTVTGGEVLDKYNLKPGPELGNVIKTLEKDKFIDKLG